MVQTQGCLVTDHVTTAFLNISSRKYFKAGVRRSSGHFFATLKDLLIRRRGPDSGWNTYKDTLMGTKLDGEINWETDPLILLHQIFHGLTEAGHFSLLIVDRTRDQAIIEYLDTLPDLYLSMMDNVKCMLQTYTPLDPDREDVWIRAKVPREAPETNDSGIFMSVIAAVESVLFSIDSRMYSISVV